MDTTRPVSVFWACVFSWTVVGVYWALRIGVVRRWLVGLVGVKVAAFVVLQMFVPFPFGLAAWAGVYVLVAWHVMRRWALAHNARVAGES